MNKEVRNINVHPGIPPLRDLSSGEPHGSRMYSGFADFCIRTRNISSENRVGIFILGIMSGVSEIIPTSHSDTVDTVFLPSHAEPEVSDRITESLLRKISRELCENRNITLTFSDEAVDTLMKKAAGNLENGGRGIGNIIEEYLINPLSRFMFDNRIHKDAQISVNGIIIGADSVNLDCTFSTDKEKTDENNVSVR